MSANSRFEETRDDNKMLNILKFTRGEIFPENTIVIGL